MREAALVLAFFALVPRANAQDAVIVTGLVTDSSGAAIGGASIEARAGGEETRTVTDRTGHYEFSVPRGDLQLVAAKPGFQPDVATLRPQGSRLVHDVTLQLGAFADSTIVTATRTEQSTSELTGSLTAFDAAAIRARGARSLAEVMQQTPGVHVEATGREGALTSLFSRGGESDYNLVLIDGVRVTLPGGRFDFSRIDASQMERVEIVRGAESALYGSDAIGAVVQVFTRRAGHDDPVRGYASIDTGSFGSLRGTAGASSGFRGRGSARAGVSYRQTDGAFADVLPERDRFDSTSFDLGGGARLGSDLSARASLRYDKSRGRSVGQIDYGIADRGTFYDTRNVSFDARVEHTLGARFHHSASAGLFDYNNFTGDRVADAAWSYYALLGGVPGARFPGSPRLLRRLTAAEFDALRTQTLPADQFLASRAAITDFASTSRMDSERQAFRYQADWTPRSAYTLTSGYEYEQENDPNNLVFGRHNHSVFAQAQWHSTSRLFASGGARLDRNSRYGGEVSPKLSAGAFVVPFRRGVVSSVKLQGNVGRGIKNPVFAELFGGATVDGNPELDPERATTFDGGGEVTFVDQRVAAVATYFDNRYRDQVAFRSSGPGKDGVPDYLNIEGSRARGMELELRLQRSTRGFTASAFYTLVDTEVTTTVSTSDQFQPGQPLLRRPKHSGNLFASWEHGKLSLNAGIRFTGQRHDSSFLSLTTVAPPGGRPRTVDITVNPGYHVALLTGEYRAHRSVAVFARVDNLTDEHYESALGFPGLPRSGAVGLRLDFSGR